MQGKRIYDIADPIGLAPGEYMRFEERWFVRAPSGHIGDITNHKVTEHEDGTITVSPSILIKSSNDGGKTWQEDWHGFLERGVWRNC